MTQLLARFKERSQRGRSMELSPQICTGVFQIGKWGGAWSATGTAVKMVRAWSSVAALENCKRRGTPGFRILTEALREGEPGNEPVLWGRPFGPR